VASVPYSVAIKGVPYPAKVTTIKDRFGNKTYQAVVVDAKGNTLGMGYGDTPMEACDGAGA
jgi:hypothetical protein